MFNKILIANRGEIAIRVMRACRELGVKTVAVYSDADKNALFTKYADEAYYLGPPEPRESYLNIEKIIDLAEKSGSEAIHPGYGFLSEDPNFARACEKAGITFIGPNADVMALLGDKVLVKRFMKFIGVPTIPGTENIRNTDEAVESARKIGYPIIIKSPSGGGGIAMRVVEEEEDLLKSFESAQSVAKSVFGNPNLYIEKFLPNARHIEIQVLADKLGNIVHLGERECSIQRRHQKLLEEAPSPIMTKELRNKMGSTAKLIVKKAKYINAGTVEFILSNGKFYFLEMNRRVQVEHAITEMVTGIDIVKEQIRIAAGYELSFDQADVKINGWAIECRINAEDPLNNFLPSPGKIEQYRSPGGIGVRVDSGVHMKYNIPHHYDPMISKLIVWGRTREEAIERMQRALYEYIIVGVKTNIPFHKAVLKNPAFRRGELNTRFVEQQGYLVGQIKSILETEKRLELSINGD